jgi:hypothetical protein
VRPLSAVNENVKKRKLTDLKRALYLNYIEKYYQAKTAEIEVT